jgi:hypothetical protein
MNKVDLYIGDYRLDTFSDEQISINLSVQNLQDISKVFTDFTQSFTVPATPNNNEILKHYYRMDVDASVVASQYSETNDSNVLALLDSAPSAIEKTRTTNSFDFRLRPAAKIELNSLPFRTGVMQMENVQIKNNEPYAYSLSFFGDLVSLTDLFGEDFLYDLDLSDYNHTYNGATIQSGFDQEALLAGDVFYPLMSPIRNWVYNVSSSSDPRHEDDIQSIGGHTGHKHGVFYNELKPAIKVVRLFDAIATKYGITFTGDFMTDSTFDKLFLWAHRFEGYLYDSTTAINWQLINFNRNTGGGTEFNLTTETWTVVDTDIYDLDITVQNAGADYELGLFQNGELIGTAIQDSHPASSITSVFEGYGFYAGDEVQLKIRPQSPVTFNYQVTDYTAYDATTVTQRFEVDQTFFATYSFQLVMSPLMPEIKVKDFVAGIVKMHNLVITPNSATSFNLQTLNGWYDDGTDVDLTSYMDVNEVSVNRPPLFREIDFKYQSTEQILGYQYKNTNTLGYGDLNATFNWDGSDFKIELPFECPLFERLTDIDTGTLTNVLVYKSQKVEPDTSADNRFQKYLGKPVLIYGEFSLDISANPIAFVDETNTEIPINEVWYANTSSTSTGTGNAYTLTWGSDIDPFYLTSVGRSLYQTYWSDYIEDLYSSKRRIVNVEGVLPLGKILNFDLKNKVIWNNQKWIVNSATVNMTTGKTTFQLLNVL